METKELICIGCPLGCGLRVELNEKGEAVSVSGNTCKRGEEYGKREVTAPVRTVTSIVKVQGGKAPVVPRTPISPRKRFFPVWRKFGKRRFPPRSGWATW